MRQLKISRSITSRESVSLGKYLQEIGKEKTIAPEEEVFLCQQIKFGNKKALDKLIKANLRFVVSVAKQYQGQGLLLSDLVNEGNIGLIYAAKRFDESRGFKFISFAVWWIRQEILRAISQQSKMIRVPLNRTLLLNRIKRTSSMLEQQLDRLPTAEELAIAMDISAEEIDELMGIEKKHVSLDTPIGEEDDHASLLDIIENPDAEMAYTDLSYTASLKTEISRHLQILTERQKETICHFFGIGTERALTLEEIARKFDLTPERVRQIKDKALLKLRTGCNFQLLRTYL
ncbi:MAG: sigma-70 family RNA polymerase sigma factor [Sphingobacteriales bacterium]|nr:sigma-70 family RNA polymerase sigma factor [Sphingobacteriales bacterium]